MIGPVDLVTSTTVADASSAVQLGVERCLTSSREACVSAHDSAATDDVAAQWLSMPADTSGAGRTAPEATCRCLRRRQTAKPVLFDAQLEQLKNEMNKLSQMQTAMSNVLNSMHTSAMSIINKIKA